MPHTGTASLPLHTGKAPPWLFSRMALLSREIVIYMVGEFGARAALADVGARFYPLPRRRGLPFPRSRAGTGSPDGVFFHTLEPPEPPFHRTRGSGIV